MDLKSSPPATEKKTAMDLSSTPPPKRVCLQSDVSPTISVNSMDEESFSESEDSQGQDTVQLQKLVETLRARLRAIQKLTQLPWLFLQQLQKRKGHAF